MKNVMFSFLCLILICGCKSQKTPPGENPNTTPEVPEVVETKTIPIVGPDGFGNAAKNYAEYCASCHGVKMEAFTDQIRKWKYGKTVPEIAKSIKVGMVKEGMPAFGATFSEQEVDNLAKYIRSGIDTWETYSFEDEPDEATVFETSAGKMRAELVFNKADIPWGMAFLPDGKMLVSDRKGDLYMKIGDGIAQLDNVPKVVFNGQGGLMDIEPHPNYNQNGWVYFSYTKPDPNGSDKMTTAVFRAKIPKTALTEIEEVFEALPYLPTQYHYGNRMEFDNNGFLFLTVGDRGKRDDNPQFLNNHCGKVHRINDDGSIPADNPFVNVEGAMKSIYSYGHRNPQGLIINKENGTIWEHEHGPRGGDELNIIKKGENYGWPLISYGINYSGTTFTDKTSDPKYKGPETYWVPSIAPCGMTMVTGDKYGDWKGDLLVGSLRFDYVAKVSVKDDVIFGEEELFPKIGRVRNVEMGLDGYIYVAVEGTPGKIYRMVPVE